MDVLQRIQNTIDNNKLLESDLFTFLNFIKYVIKEENIKPTRSLIRFIDNDKTKLQNMWEEYINIIKDWDNEPEIIDERTDYFTEFDTSLISNNKKSVL